MKNERLPDRRSVRLQHFDYGGTGEYFITICTDNRKEHFGQIKNGIMCLNALGALAWEEWEITFDKRNDFAPGAFIVMPNHLHGIIHIQRPADDDFNPARIETFGSSSKDTLATMMKGLKSAVTSRAGKEHDFHEKLWQRGFYDHVIRNAAEYKVIDGYILSNPGKWNDDCFHP